MKEIRDIDSAFAFGRAAGAGTADRPLWSRAWAQAVDAVGASLALGLLTPSEGTGYGLLFSGSEPQLPLARDKIETLHRRLVAIARAPETATWWAVPREVRQMLRGRFDTCEVVLTRALPISEAEVFWPIVGFPPDTRPTRAAMERCAHVLALAAKACIGDLSAQRSHRLLESVLDQLSASIFVTTQQGRLMWANQAGRHGLAAGNPLRCGSDRRLAAVDRGDAHALAEAYSTLAASDGVRRLPADRMFALGRAGCQRGALLRSLDLGGPTGAVLLLIVFAEGDDLAAIDFKRVFGLIPSEARFIGNMMQRGSLKAAATALGISEQSARTYLKRVYAKLGVSNQLELACLVASYAPPVVRARQPTGIEPIVRS